MTPFLHGQLSLLLTLVDALLCLSNFGKGSSTFSYSPLALSLSVRSIFYAAYSPVSALSSPPPLQDYGKPMTLSGIEVDIDTKRPTIARASCMIRIDTRALSRWETWQRKTRPSTNRSVRITTRRRSTLIRRLMRAASAWTEHDCTPHHPSSCAKPSLGRPLSPPLQCCSSHRPYYVYHHLYLPCTPSR
jgi:hypothetical protein